VGVDVGDCADNIVLYDADGVEHSLWDDYTGQIIVLDFSGFT
jgi:hypothetical protein